MLITDEKTVNLAFLSLKQLANLKRIVIEREAELRVRENKRKYKNYLESEEWQNARKMVLKYYPKCCRCGSTDRLNVHHGSYKNLTKEKPSDLFVLCGSCHKEFHERFPLEENIRTETKFFIREKNKDFHVLMCMPPDEVEHRTSNHHCKYCNSPLIIHKAREKQKRGKRKYYYSKIWKCEKDCTYGVNYTFEEDIVYFL